MTLMTLHVDAVRGQSMWWVWAIRDAAGTLVEKSATQFRSAVAAEVDGRAKLDEFEERRQRHDGQ